MFLPASEPDPAVALPAEWWAGGLTFADRLPAPASAWRDETVGERLAQWRDRAGAGFPLRLSDAQVDEDMLVQLLAEPRPVLAARTTRPDWAQLVVDALASSCPGDGQLPLGADDPHVDALARPLRPFIADAVARVVDHARAMAEPVAADLGADRFAADLAARLVELAARTLVLELNIARVSGRLVGETGGDRFADFLDRVGTGAGLSALFAEYPVLGRLLTQTCDHAVAAYTELLERFAADRSEIVESLFAGVDPGPLRDVELGRGDRHHRGRAVAVLVFAADRRIVYKPRSQDLLGHFNDIVGWLNSRRPGLDLRTAAVLPRRGYGWVEFIEQRACAHGTEIERFYRRQGGLLALLHALDATDIHRENLIAAADQPVCVDVETLFHPTLNLAVAVGADPALDALRSSVMRTSLLPFVIVGEHGAADLSALGGDDGATSPFDSISWDAGGTDEMRLARRPTRVRATTHRPRLAGAEVDPVDHQRALMAGFRAGYDAIVTHREELLELVDRCRDDEIRVIARPTRAYLAVLAESTHPDLLRDALDRDGLFDALWADAAHNRPLGPLVRHESTDLWAGDVPLFTSRPASRDLWASTGVRVRNVLAHTGFDAAHAKIAAMDEVDRLDQEWIITAAMSTRGDAVDHRSGRFTPGVTVATVPDQDRLLAAASGIADDIVGRSRQRGERANWIGVERVDGRHWTLMPLGAGLGDGFTGVALFLAQLGALTGSSRYLSLARKALTPVHQLIRTLAAQPALAGLVGPGAFVGTGGICYALARLATLLDDADIRAWLADAVEVTATIDEGSAGIATGHAGGLLTMLSVHAETGMESALRAARASAARLRDATGLATEPTGETFPPTGYANGSIGVEYALRRFAAANGGDHPEIGSRRSPWTPAADYPASNIAWCTGLAGHLLAASDTVVGPSPELDKAVAVLAEQPPLRDASLCHGELGVIEALVVLSERGHEQARSLIPLRASRALGTQERHGLLCGTPGEVPSPGLLTGLAGIGYGLLRLGFADLVPSVLLLETADVRTARQDATR